ncbi:MAG: tRNA uridine-5-carboxymethylaminomethyl(34) synthesis GTPase MnmE [Eubacteriales bacterium]|nr:tRNA uridine-5-carboxymethylaminomethyl(34) synthesis GTPase MnmE [Eubacteriales bacterium]
MTEDTICALATPPGEGGIAVIRISGPEAETVLYRVFRPFSGQIPLAERRMTLGIVADADKAMAVVMRAPYSYTGEDVCELQLHGGRALCAAILETLYAAGARVAEPGEFTKRAFLNGKIDLSEAEAVQSLIGASTAAAARAAYAVLRGGLSEKTESIRGELTDTIASLEALIDYPDEYIPDDVTEKLARQTGDWTERLRRILAGERGARLFHKGLRAVIAGSPNVGKSSLLNCLCGTARAIVTDEAGTTRDTLDVTVDVMGIPVTFIDTAGLRHGTGKAESIGIERAVEAMRNADIVLAVRECGGNFEDALTEGLARLDPSVPVVRVANKIDLADEERRSDTVYVSALGGEGIDALKRRVFEMAGGVPVEDVLVTDQRQCDCLREALDALELVRQGIDAGAGSECLLVDLRGAWSALGRVTGRGEPEEIIDRIFSKFCLGK